MSGIPKIGVKYLVAIGWQSSFNVWCKLPPGMSNPVPPSGGSWCPESVAEDLLHGAWPLPYTSWLNLKKTMTKHYLDDGRTQSQGFNNPFTD
jgi:hypothetical protein